MKADDIFRFPEEEKWEAALRGLPREALAGILSRVADTLPEKKRYSEIPERLCAVLDVLARSCDAFLRTWNGRTDVFGRIRNQEELYRDCCRLQETVAEGVRRLSGTVNRISSPQSVQPYDRWAVTRLAQGAVAEEAVTAEAKALTDRLAAAERAEARLTQQTEQVRGFLRGAVQTYAERSLILSDAENGGKSIRAGALLSLAAEFRTAAAECRRAVEAAAGNSGSVHKKDTGRS